MSRPTSFTASQVARMLGMGRTTVRKEIARGHLVATRAVAAKGGLDMAYRIQRDDLVRWLVACGFPIDQLRSILNPDGSLLLVRCNAAMQVAITKTPTFALGSLFSLGQELLRRPCWGVVIDLPAVGSSEACASLAEMSSRYDRPLLIGLYGDDGAGIEPRLVETFDVLLPRSSPPPVLARSIQLLRPGTRAKDYIQPPAPGVNRG